MLAAVRHIGLLLLFPLLLSAQFPQLHPEWIASGLKRPTSLAAPADNSNRIFVSEQEGTVRIVRGGQTMANAFLNITDRIRMPDPICCDERGLLSVAFPPDFTERPFVYVAYTARDNAITLSRFAISDDPDYADPHSEEIIFQLPHQYDNHFGSALAFSPKNGKLYLSTGDGAGGGDPLNSGQDPKSLFAKVLRFEVSAGDFTPEIVAMGFRNPWRMTFDRQTGDLFIGDVGDNDWEEVDYLPADSTTIPNYGWSILEGNHCLRPDCGGQSTEGLTPPIFEYSHNIGCSVTSGYVYRGSVYPDLYGAYLAGDFCNGTIWGLRKDGDAWRAEVVIDVSGFNISAFGEDQAGELYFVDYLTGDLYQIGLEGN